MNQFNLSNQDNNKVLQEAVLITMLLFSGGKYNPNNMILDTAIFIEVERPYEGGEIPNTLDSFDRLEEKEIIEELPEGWKSEEQNDKIIRLAG